MRVISGKAKGRRLQLVPGETTRPITDRVKENLFNLLGPHFVPGTRWLDLFAGTGQVGIEALSRGAREVVFIDNVRIAVRTVFENLERVEMKEKAKVWQTDAFVYLHKGPDEPFDVIFVAPPQYKRMWIEVVRSIDPAPQVFLTEPGIVIVQIDPVEYEELELEGLSLYDQRTYGNTMLCFYERADYGDQ